MIMTGSPNSQEEPPDIAAPTTASEVCKTSKANKTKIIWTDEKKSRLADLAFEHRGYIRTDIAMDEKWARILKECNEDKVTFPEGLNVTPTTLRKTFIRFMDDFSTEEGLIIYQEGLMPLSSVNERFFFIFNALMDCPPPHRA
jgi:hypothetical protein